MFYFIILNVIYALLQFEAALRHKLVKLGTTFKKLFMHTLRIAENIFVYFKFTKITGYLNSTPNLFLNSALRTRTHK